LLALIVVPPTECDLDRTWATALVITGRRPGWGTIPRGAALHEALETELVPARLPR
jgi:hypothetical protein